jgi:hypothetical protein
VVIRSPSVSSRSVRIVTNVGLNDWNSCGSLAWAAIVFLVIAGMIPTFFRRTVIKSHTKLAHRRRSVFRSVKLGGRQGVPAAADHSVTMKDASMKESEVLSQEEIARVRKLRKASIRRRRIIVFTLLIVLIALLVCAGLFHFSYWWAAIPAVLLVTVLALGAHASAVARAWERKVAMQSFPAASKSEENTADAEVSEASNQSTANNSGNTDHVSENGAPTHVIPLPEVREILAQQAHEKEVQEAERAKQAEHQYNSAQADKAKTDKVKAEATQSEMVKSAQSSSDRSKPDLISFSLGTSDSVPHVTKSADDKNSEKRSDQKIAKKSDKKPSQKSQKSSAATTPSAPSSHKAVKPSAEARRQIFADVTPSVTTIHRVSAPRKSADSLGVDLNAVLARRQK